MSILLFSRHLSALLCSAALCLLLAACISRVPRPTPTAKPPPVVKPAPLSGALAVYATRADGTPLAGAAIVLRDLDGENKDSVATPAPDSTIDLIDHQFQPRVLIVQSGNTVVFNNLDTVEHQIYSFSTNPPLDLDLRPDQSRRVSMPAQTTVVTLGCKIYNQMLGYVLITDAAIFGTTDSSGFLRFRSLPPGSYRVKLWYADSHTGVHSELSATATVTSGQEQLLRFALR